MSEFRADGNVGGYVATLSEPDHCIASPRGMDSIRGKIRAARSQSIARFLPEEPMNAYTLCKLAEFNSKDDKIKRETFLDTGKETYTTLRNASPMAIPAGTPTEELEEYLASKGKQRGNELHLFAFAIAHPDYQRTCPVAALSKWVVLKGLQESKEKEEKKDILVPEHLVNDKSLPIFFPCISGTPTTRDLRTHLMTIMWNPTVQVIVTDLG